MLSDLKAFTKKERLFVVITLCYIAYSVLPAVAAVTHITIDTICLGVTVAFACLYPEYLFGSKFLKWFYGYALILAMYAIVGHRFHINGLGNNALFRNLLIETAWTLPNLLLSCILINKNDSRLYKIVGVGAMVIIFLSFITILPVLIQSAGILRQNLKDAENATLYNPFLPSYTLMSSYTYFFPAICYGLHRFRGRPRILFAILTAILFYVIFKTEITTSMLVMFAIIIMALTYKDDNRSQFTAAVCIMLVILLLYKTGAILAFVDFMRELYDGTVAAIKFDDFHNRLTGAGGDDSIEVRRVCREISRNTFYQNPLFGGVRVGSHSSILDRLGSMGLIGFIPWAAMMFTLMKSNYYVLCDRSTKFFYLCGVAAVLIFLYMKGLFSGQGMLCLAVILPSSLYALEQIVNRRQDEGKQ